MWAGGNYMMLKPRDNAAAVYLANKHWAREGRKARAIRIAWYATWAAALVVYYWIVLP
jgi:hypothetical protein